MKLHTPTSDPIIGNNHHYSGPMEMCMRLNLYSNIKPQTNGTTATTTTT